uniref:MADS-box domain-containing protein n=1 Tax=Leersia perrieri TaxID=77586 RepID=A0A0D9XP99_9ORYZ
MTRGRVKLQQILNDAQRRATFKKWLKGLMKKAKELATLCGMDTCLIVHGKGEAHVTEVWPLILEAANMTRGRVKLQQILNGAQRRATFKKRLKGLMKKDKELATLCFMDTCLIVYGKGEAYATEVWPLILEAASVLEHFMAIPWKEYTRR